MEPKLGAIIGFLVGTAIFGVGTLASPTPLESWPVPFEAVVLIGGMTMILWLMAKLSV